MKDSSLSPLEKNAKIQQIIRGNFEGADVATTKAADKIITNIFIIYLFVSHSICLNREVG